MQSRGFFRQSFENRSIRVVSSKPPWQMTEDEASQPETNQSEQKAGKCLMLKGKSLRN